MSTVRSLSPNSNFLLPTTCLENRLESKSSQPDAKQLRDMVQEMVDSIFTSHEHQMMAHLRQVDSRHLDAVQDLQERISVCEAKLLNVPASGKDSESEAADGTAAAAELRDVVAECKATVAKCEAAIAEHEATVAERDRLSQKVDGELVILPRQTSGGAAPTPASQNQSSSKELEFSSKELQESRKHKKSASASALTSATASDASSGGAGYVRSESAYVLQESVWDCAMLIGMPHMHNLGSCWIALLFFINVFMQTTLCCVINDIFTIPTYDDGTVSDMVHWRLTSAHAWEFVDRQTYVPLAQRICTFDGSVPMSSGVARVLGAIAGYMPNRQEWESQNPYPFGKLLQHSEDIGIQMCLISVAIWLLMVGEDFEEIWSLTKSLAFVPVGSSTHLHRHADGTYVWKSTTTRRRVWCFMIVFLKAFVATCLAIDGMFYLIFTISLRELLLNCSALQIVLDLDDIIFQALAPYQACKMISNMEPLPQSMEMSFGSLNALPVVVFSIIVANLIVISATVLREQTDILEQARHEICGGNINFVTSRDSTGLIYATEVTKDVEHHSYPNAATQELIWTPMAVHTGFLDGSLSAVAVGMSGGQFTLGGISDRPVYEMTAIRNSRCLDLLSTGDQDVSAIRLILEDVAGESVTSCESVEKHCSGDSPAGIRARQYCPETCGCSHPGSSQVLVGDSQGCSFKCEDTDRYQLAVSSRSCSDEVANGTMLRNYIEGLESYVWGAPDDWKPDIQRVIAQVRSKGCDGVISWNSAGMRYAWDDLCVVSSSWSLQSLAFACPEACECAELNLFNCPPSCKPNVSS